MEDTRLKTFLYSLVLTLYKIIKLQKGMECVLCLYIRNTPFSQSVHKLRNIVCVCVCVCVCETEKAEKAK